MVVVLGLTRTTLASAMMDIIGMLVAEMSTFSNRVPGPTSGYLCRLWQPHSSAFLCKSNLLGTPCYILVSSMVSMDNLKYFCSTAGMFHLYWQCS